MDSEDRLTREEIFSHISSNCADILFKNQQRGEPDLTDEEKRRIGCDLLESNPQKFISKFGN